MFSNSLIIRTLSLILIAGFLSSCLISKRTAEIEDINQSLRLVHKAVSFSLTGAIKKRSINNRVYFSKYHRLGKDLNTPVAGHLKRGQVIIAILNGQRPYSVEVAYRVEKYEDGKFSLSHYDQSLADKYRNLVNDYLVSRPDGRDMIDDFRPY